MITHEELRRKFIPSVFNRGDEVTSIPSSSLVSFVREISQHCCVCHAPEANVAHILMTKKKCHGFGLPWNASNFLYLCGAQGMIGTCRHLFATFQMSIVQTGESEALGKWIVIGGGDHHHGKLITLPTNPHKKALHSHFARAVRNEALVGYDGSPVNVLDSNDEEEEEEDDDDDVDVDES